MRREPFSVLGGNDHNEADAVVEDAVHFMAVDVALFLQPVEDGRTGPGLAVDDGLNAFGKNAGNVFDEAAAVMWAMPLIFTDFMTSRTCLT